MAVPLEERQKPLSDLGGLHRAWSLGAAASAQRGDPAARCKSPCTTRFPAISVQFRAEPAGAVQLWNRKVCIACAGMRLARIYADDAPEMLQAERLVGEARQRRARRMDQRERVVTGVSACAYLAVAVAIAAFVPDERHVAPVVVLGLLFGYALILQVRFEFGGYYASPEQLAFIPLLLVAPLPYVPLLFAAAGVLAAVPDIARNSWHRHRWLDTFSDSWAALGGVIVLAALAPGDLDSAYFAVYVAAFAAHFLTDVTWTLLRNRLLDRLPLGEVLRGFAGTARVDAILTPLAFVVSLAAVEQPLYLLAIAPVVWLLHLFSHDRRERYSKTLELHRAYRGTVMLLSDVIESEDTYTAQHSRSVVDL